MQEEDPLPLWVHGEPFLIKNTKYKVYFPELLYTLKLPLHEGPGCEQSMILNFKNGRVPRDRQHHKEL